MRQLTEVLTYLHSNDIVHRDLKLENVLLKSPINSATDKIDIRVTDFGLAHMKSLSDLEDPIMDERCGTPYYMAPEVILSRHEYTKMCDVWSLGVIMYYIICGKVPFHGDANLKLEECIVHGEPTFKEVEWINISEQAQTLIRGMLCKDTTRRLTAMRVLNDAWFTGQPSKFFTAIELMEDMTGHASSTSQRPSLKFHTSTHQPPSVKKTSTSGHHPRHPSPSPRTSHQHHSEKPSLQEKRFRSTSTLDPNPPTTSPSSSGQLKNYSTSSLRSRSPGRQRSVSVGQRPSTTAASSRKISHQQTTHEHPEHQHTLTSSQHKQRAKQSSHSTTSKT
ncbi:Serine/threonine-protein kinase 33 [Geodia barretti]|nr:Serine/threonine-protein kinase 33 [Geodia barretti]